MQARQNAQGSQAPVIWALAIGIKCPMARMKARELLNNGRKQNENFKRWQACSNLFHNISNAHGRPPQQLFHDISNAQITEASEALFPVCLSSHELQPN